MYIYNNNTYKKNVDNKNNNNIDNNAIAYLIKKKIIFFSC